MPFGKIKLFQGRRLPVFAAFLNLLNTGEVRVELDKGQGGSRLLTLGLFSLMLIAQPLPPPTPPDHPAEQKQSVQHGSENKSPGATEAAQHGEMGLTIAQLVFSGVLAATAIIQICIYLKQTSLMKSALRETTKAADAATAAADAAGISARATQQQVIVATHAITSAAASAAASAKSAAAALAVMREQSAAQSKTASATEKLAEKDTGQCY